MKNTLKMALVSGLILVLLQCSGKSNMQIATPGTEIKAPAEAMSVQARVLADSGATLSIGRSLQLTVPAGALEADTDISVTKTQAAPQQENLVPVGNAIELGAHGTEFNKSVTLNTCYDPAALAAKGLAEDTLQVYYVDPDSGNYAAIGGTVNKGSHCVTAQLQHFSTYLVAAQILQGGNNPPVVSAPTFTPSVPLAGLPLKVSSIITDYELSTVNGQVGFGQVATAQLYYRIPGEPSFTQVSLTPDYLDDTATRYSYKIPANRVTTAGIEYYLKATDNLGLNRVRNTAVLPVTRTVTSIAFSSNAVVDIAAGFKRSYTLRAIDDLAVARNIDVDSFTLNGGIGTATKTSASVIQVSATTANPQNYRIGSLTANAGAFSVTSQDIRVHAGMLDHIELLSPTGVVLGSTITVNANATYDFDIIGYDAFGNTSNVLPLFVIVPVSGAGTITSTGLYTAPATAQTATLVATLDGVMDSILINVVVPVFSTATDLNQPRFAYGTTKLQDGRILVMGGWDGTAAMASSEVFSENTGSFTVSGSLNYARSHPTSVLLADGRVLIAGGTTQEGSSTLIQANLVAPAEIYNPATGVFTVAASMNVPRYLPTAILMPNGKVLFVGGYIAGSYYLHNAAEVYDPATNTFTNVGNTNSGRYGSVASLLPSGKVLLTGGYYSGWQNSAEIFDPATAVFTSTGSMLYNRISHTADLLSNGKVYILGGYDGNNQLASAQSCEYYTENTGVFSSCGTLLNPRYGFSSVVLPNGLIMISGGYDATPLSAQVKAVDLFDPNSNTFTADGMSSYPHAENNAFLLPSGHAFLMGGSAGFGPTVSRPEIFIP